MTNGIRWFEAEPEVLEREMAAMAAVAPDMNWDETRQAGVWCGYSPEWPARRPRPDGLGALLNGKRLRLEVAYRQSHPAVPPILNPLDPMPAPDQRLAHIWHVNGDGTLCLLAAPWLWRSSEVAADLVLKAAGWFIEYRLMEEGLIDAMSDDGILVDASHDAAIAQYAN